MIGSDITLSVTRKGHTYNVRCNYDNSSKRATISSNTSEGFGGSGGSQSRIAFVNVDSVNVRSAPGTDSKVLYSVPRNTEMKIVGETSRGDSIWYKVQPRSNKYPQATGYVFSRYLTIR